MFIFTLHMVSMQSLEMAFDDLLRKEGLEKVSFGATSRTEFHFSSVL